MKSSQLNQAFVRLPRGAAYIDGFNAVVRGIPDEVRERITEQLQHALVDLGFFPAGLESDALAG